MRLYGLLDAARMCWKPITAHCRRWCSWWLQVVGLVLATRDARLLVIARLVLANAAAMRDRVGGLKLQTWDPGLVHATSCWRPIALGIRTLKKTFFRFFCFFSNKIKK